MMVQLPEDLEIRVRALVQSGHFASIDDVLAVAVRQLIRRRPMVGKPADKEAFHQHLIATGRMTSLPDPSLDYDDPDDQLITIEGEPLSETIIRERR